MKTISTATVVSSQPAYKHLINTGSHQLVTDEPVSSGGQDAGPAPYDFILAGLGSCTAITLEMYAGKKGWTLGQLNVELTLQKDHDGNTHIERVLHISEPLNEEQWQKLLDIAGKTPVTKTLLQGASINTQRG